MHATGKSPRGLRGDSSSELVLDFMQKDLAAAKAQQYNLQADVAALSENNRRTQQEAERQKSLVYEQMYALQAELDKCKQELKLAREREKRQAQSDVDITAQLRQTVAALQEEKAVLVSQQAASQQRQ